MIWTLPNILTLSRIALTPVIALLPFINGWVPKLMALLVFLAAAISDFYDGRLARERDEVTDLGKLLDPLADKLLLFATLVPIYWITRYPLRQYEIPWWGNLPLMVALLLVGREIAMTVFRQVAKTRGVV
ncbi:MAG: CDP-alcohol phosphatidyltransferase family protein, partial [Gemmatimonadetes bacterium]|nr:CDP-alcohol phosphatidyltransferase family protein [Gemmatimonadota bacterium]